MFLFFLKIYAASDMKVRGLRGVGLSHSEQGSAVQVTRVSDINHGRNVSHPPAMKLKIIRIPALILFFVECHG
jgi:hypothetical protein